VSLIATGILSFAVLFLANEDPFVRKMVYGYTGFRLGLPHAEALYKILYDGAVGALVTLIFYLLVVRWPDYQKRRRLKKGLARQFRIFKEDCIGIMLMATDGTYDAALPDALMEQDKFRDYFKEKVAPDRDRWDEFLNNLNARHLRELQTHMEIFRDELGFVLNNTDIPKDKPFEFIKRLSTSIYIMEGITLDYDDTKILARFLWEIFAG
jgi:hypothetical protein